jgi:hypothetical protein
LAEAHLIADALGVTWQQFTEEYIDERWPGTQSLLIRQNHGLCVFLKTCRHKGCPPTADCLIHYFKPLCCREWKTALDRPECQQGLKQQWGLTVDSSRGLRGPEDKLKAFARYINRSPAPFIQNKKPGDLPSARL